MFEICKGKISLVIIVKIERIYVHNCDFNLKVKQSKVINEKGEKLNLIDLTGPILPNVLHMLCPLLSKTVQEYKIHVTTVDSTVSLNMEMET